MNKILITGSNGLLGTAFKSVLGFNDPNIVYHSRDLFDLRDALATKIYIKDQIENNGVDTIIHAAAIVGGIQANLQENERFLTDNVLINNNIINSALENKVDNFVNILSTCIFPAENIKYPLTKDQIDLGPPHPSNSGYAYAKRLSGHQTKILGEAIGKNWFSVIPPNLYGKNDNFNHTTSHLVGGLIHRAYIAKKNNTKLTIWGDGSPLRQFLYSEDLARIVIEAIGEWKSNDHYMVVNPNEMSVMEIANIICDEFGIDKNNIDFDLTKPKGQFRKPADSDVSEYSFKPFKEGIKETVEWFKENYEKART